VTVVVVGAVVAGAPVAVVTGVVVVAVVVFGRAGFAFGRDGFAFAFCLLMPEPNSWPELELPDGCPRALESGIEYSFAAGLPGSTCTPGGVAEPACASATPGTDPRASAATIAPRRDR